MPSELAYNGGAMLFDGGSLAPFPRFVGIGWRWRVAPETGFGPDLEGKESHYREHDQDRNYCAARVCIHVILMHITRSLLPLSLKFWPLAASSLRASSLKTDQTRLLWRETHIEGAGCSMDQSTSQDPASIETTQYVRRRSVI